MCRKDAQAKMKGRYFMIIQLGWDVDEIRPVDSRTYNECGGGMQINLFNEDGTRKTEEEVCEEIENYGK